MSLTRITALSLIMLVILLTGVGTTLSSSNNSLKTVPIKTYTVIEHQPHKKAQEVVVNVVNPPPKAPSEAKKRWYIVASSKKLAERVIRPSGYMVEPDVGYYIVISDRVRGEVNGTAVITVVALNNKGPVPNAHAILQVCSEDYSICYNYSVVTNDDGIDRVIVRLNTSYPLKNTIIRLTNYTELASDTEIRYYTLWTWSEESGAIMTDLFGMIDTLSPGMAWIIFGDRTLEVNEAENITLHVFAINFTGDAFNGKLRVIVNLEPDDTVLYNDTTQFINGLANITLSIPKINKVDTLVTSIYTLDNKLVYVARPIVVAPKLFYVIPLEEDYTEYNARELNLPIMVVDNHGIVLGSGNLSYEVCVYNSSGFYNCSGTLTTSVSNGLAYIKIPPPNIGVENINRFDVEILKVYVNNVECAVLGDKYLSGYRHIPPPSTTTTTTTTPPPPPLDIYLYTERKWSGNYHSLILRAHVYENGEPAPNLTVYFYLPWNGTQVYKVETDEDGIAELNMTDIIRSLYSTHPDLFYGDHTYVVAVVSNGNYAAFDYEYISRYDIIFTLGWILMYDQENNKIVTNPVYSDIRLPVLLFQTMLEYHWMKYGNSTKLIGLLVGGENASMPTLPQNYFGKILLAAITHDWEYVLGFEFTGVTAHGLANIRITRVGSVTGDDLSWADLLVGLNESIPVEGVVESLSGNPLSNVRVYAALTYEESNGIVLRDTYTLNNGTFSITFPPTSETTYYDLFIVGVLPNGTIVSGYDEWEGIYVKEVNGDITVTTPTTTTTVTNTTTTTTTTTSSPTTTTTTTSITTTTTTTTTLTTSPTLVGGTLKIYEEEGSSRTTTYLAIAIVAAAMLIAGVISMRRRRLE